MTQKNEITETGEQIVKKKRGRGGIENFPSVLGNMKKEDVQRIGRNLLRWYKLDKAVTDEEIAERLDYYFTTCFTTGEHPTNESMCLALGYDRSTIWKWENGSEGSTTMRRNLIKKAKELLAAFDAGMVNDGKINPIVYIFRAKNYFGLQDKQEYVLTPNNPLGDLSNLGEIQKRLSDGVADD